MDKRLSWLRTVFNSKNCWQIRVVHLRRRGSDVRLGCDRCRCRCLVSVKPPPDTVRRRAEPVHSVYDLDLDSRLCASEAGEFLDERRIVFYDQADPVGILDKLLKEPVIG